MPWSLVARQLTINMLRELVSHVAPPANTSGPLLLVYDEQEAGSSCPCVTGSTNGNRIPSFVGQNYFCKAGLTQLPGFINTFWPNGDPLWDGQGVVPLVSTV